MDVKVAPDNEKAALISSTLSTIQKVSGFAVLAGLGGTICGILTLIYTDPMWKFPFSSASGIWGCLPLFAMGLVGLNVVRLSGRPAGWVYAYQGLSQGCTTVGSMHTGYSIGAVVICGIPSDNCNLAEQDNMIIISAFSIFFGLCVFCIGLFNLCYLYKNGRGAALTNNPNYGRCGRCC